MYWFPCFQIDSIALQTDYVALHVSDLTPYDLAIELWKRGVGLIVLAEGSGAMNVSSSDTRIRRLVRTKSQEIWRESDCKNLSKFSPSTGRQVFGMCSIRYSVNCNIVGSVRIYFSFCYNQTFCR